MIMIITLQISGWMFVVSRIICIDLKMNCFFKLIFTHLHKGQVQETRFVVFSYFDNFDTTLWCWDWQHSHLHQSVN